MRLAIVLTVLGLAGCSFSGEAGTVDMEIGNRPESKTVREVHYREVTTTTSSKSGDSGTP